MGGRCWVQAADVNHTAYFRAFPRTTNASSAREAGTRARFLRASRPPAVFATGRARFSSRGGPLPVGRPASRAAAAARRMGRLRQRSRCQLSSRFEISPSARPHRGHCGASTGVGGGSLRQGARDVSVAASPFPGTCKGAVGAEPQDTSPRSAPSSWSSSPSSSLPSLSSWDKHRSSQSPTLRRSGGRNRPPTSSPSSPSSSACAVAAVVVAGAATAAGSADAGPLP